jgi:hypothetical protein
MATIIIDLKSICNCTYTLVMSSGSVYSKGRIFIDPLTRHDDLIMNGKANYGVNYAPTIATDDTKFEILQYHDYIIKNAFEPRLFKFGPDYTSGVKRPRDDDVESLD